MSPEPSPASPPEFSPLLRRPRSEPEPPEGAEPPPPEPAGEPGRRQAAQPRLAREPEDARQPADGSATRLTGRGAVIAMLAVFFLGTLLAGWVHLGVLAGLSFLAGCVLAARYTKREGLLTVTVSPPILFLIALVAAEVLTSHAKGTARHAVASVAEGTILTLAGVAPWLFGGVIAGLIIATARGLRECIRGLAADLRGGTPSRVR